MEIKKILCFGDSNTWGYIPGSKRVRFLKHERFPGILQNKLGSGIEVIEEGLNSRTLISEDPRPNKEGRNGSTYLIPCLDSHDPLDFVILMLGTNELKEIYNNTAEEISSLLEKFFVNAILNRKSQFTGKRPQLIIVSPPNVNETTEYAGKLYKGATLKSKQLTKLYQNIAEKYNCLFVDGSYLDVGEDGVHLTKESHNYLADKIFERIN